MDVGRVTLMAELWFDAEPQLDPEALVEAVPGSELVSNTKVLSLAHPRFAHENATIITTVAAPGEERDHPLPTAEQTWDWAEAGEVIASCTHSLVLLELFGRPHEHHERIEAFLATLRGAIALTRPRAVWCPNCWRVARPAELLEDELPAFVNVRLFRESEDDEVSLVMDTFGLNSFGLPDAQCRFSSEDHEPNEIATVLYDLGAYILDRGDVISEGDTVGDLPWRVHDSEAIVGPGRRVLALERDEA